MFKTTEALILIACLAGLCCFVAAAVFAFKRRRRDHAEWLLKNGVPIATKFTGFSINTSVKSNGRFPYRLRTTGRHPITGEEMEFKSDNIWENIANIAIRPGHDVTVYCDPDKPKRYWVDMTEWKGE